MREKLVIFFSVIGVFLYSLYLIPFYSGGDLLKYNAAYSAIANMGLVEAFLTYRNHIGTLEFVHFLLVWVSSSLGIERVFFISSLNALLSLTFLLVLKKFRANLLIGVVIVFCNLYFIVLFTELERLKVSFIFLFMAFWFFENKKRFYFFSALAIMAHSQMLILYFGLFFVLLLKQFYRALFYMVVERKFLFLFIGLAALFLVMSENIFSKFSYYYHGLNFIDVLKFLPFVAASAFYAKNKSNAIIIFIPILVLVMLVGGSRLNILGYFMFLYFGFQYRKGINIGILVTTLYFAVQSITFVENIFHTGRGYAF